MQGPELHRFIVGVIGNVISGFLFLSPLPTFWRIYKKKSTEEFHPYPYLAAFMNCIFWIFYGLPFIHPDSTLVITINSFGLFMEIVYLSTFFYFSSKNEHRKRILWVIPAEFLVLGVVAVITLLTLKTTDQRSMVVGILCDIFGIIMYASPLSNMIQVFKTKSVEYMPFWLCLVGFLNGCTWFTYAFLWKFDPYIAAGNGIGAFFGAIQLLMIAYYTCMYPKKVVEDGVKPTKIQLQNVV